MRMRRGFISVLVLVLLSTLGGGATSHPLDVFSNRKAGPIRRARTTFDQVKEWFGPPASAYRHPYQCITVIDAKWPGRFRMWFSTYDESMVVVLLNRRRAYSRGHGWLDFHTRRFLQVGDTKKAMLNKYPNARRHDHDGYAHYILVSNIYGRLEATTSRGRITQLRTFPYEAC